MTAKYRAYLLVAVAAASLIIVAVWIAPRILGIYYLEKGGQLLEKAIHQADDISKDEIICAQSPTKVDTARSLTRDALRLLLNARNSNKPSPHLYLLEGRGNCLLGKFDEAIKRYKKYIFFNPDNPLGHLELGFIYDQMGDLQTATQEWRLSEIKSSDFVLVGEKYRQSGNLHKASLWFNRAGILSGFILDESVPNNRFSKVEILESFLSTDNWKPYSSNVPGNFFTEMGILFMGYENDPIDRDTFGYELSVQENIEAFDELIIRARGNQNTYLSLEVVIDGIRLRLLNYFQVGKDFQIYSFPIKGSKLSSITLGISERKGSSYPIEYSLWVDWIGLSKQLQAEDE